MTNQNKQHESVNRRGSRTDVNAAAKLGDSLKSLMDKRILPRQQKFTSITQLWDQLLPEELALHCRIVDISGGELKVEVDSPAYAHELRWCSSGILKQLQQNCPAARIKKIKCVLGRSAYKHKTFK